MQLNELIAAQSSYDMFVTVFYAMLEIETRSLLYANAGHNPPLLWRGSGEIEHLTRTGRIVGAFETLSLHDAGVVLAPGDALVIYTDGVTDALNSAGEEYGIERLTAALQNAPRPASLLLQRLSADLAAFTQTAAQPDDITFFVLTCE